MGAPLKNKPKTFLGAQSINRSLLTEFSRNPESGDPRVRHATPGSASRVLHLECWVVLLLNACTESLSGRIGPGDLPPLSYGKLREPLAPYFDFVFRAVSHSLDATSLQVPDRADDFLDIAYGRCFIMQR